MSRPISLCIRPLTLADLDAVMALEAVSFADPWPRSTYQRELTHSRNSRYLKVSPVRPLPGVPGLIAQGGIMRFGEEMHIVTIAVLPGWRGRSIGEWLLLALLAAGRAEGAQLASLEVRVSNRAAQQLYAKFGFVQAGYRRRYYPDKEDALILTLENLHTGAVWTPLAKRLDELSGQMKDGVAVSFIER